MNNVQKIFFAGIILLAVFLGNRFSNSSQADGSSRNNSAGFSASESPSFLAQSVSVVEPAERSSNSVDSISSSATSASRPQSGWNSVSGTRDSNAPELKAGAPNDSQSETGSTGSAISSNGSVFYQFTKTPAPDVAAQETLIADLRSGEIYLETNADARWPMASLTKLLTAVMVIKNIDLKSGITFAPADFSGGEETNFFKVGSLYSVNDVLAAMLLLSKNEAAEALADNFGREKFIGGLNKIAAEWGMDRTHFADPTGLSIANQSTARDIQKLALRVYQEYPNIFRITRQKKAVITDIDSKKKTTISNINNFAGRSDFLGGKTGYTDEASGNLLSLFSYKRRPILIIVLGTNDRFGETDKLFSWFKNNFRASR